MALFCVEFESKGSDCLPSVDAQTDPQGYLDAFCGNAKTAKAAKTALPAFKQYREKDGKFYFKLVAADGRLLLQSTGFDAPKDAGQAIVLLQREGLGALAERCTLTEGAAQAEVQAALQALAETAAAKE